MVTKAKTSVFFVATKSKKEPLVLNFYTEKGESVPSSMVKKVRTKQGVRFYVDVSKSKNR